MEEYIKKDRPPHEGMSNRIWLGVILFFAGLALLGYKLGLPLPSWLFTWPMILILVGIGIGFKDKFQNPGSWILLLIGSLFLADQNIHGFNFQRFILPTILIVAGLVYIIRPRPDRRIRHFMKPGFPEIPPANNVESNPTSEFEGSSPEYINIQSVFGGVKKIIVSKNFKGGTINTFMGGAEINLLQADIQEPVSIDINNVFGGMKLIVPVNWNVKNEITAVFGGVEDERNPGTMNPDESKTIYMKGSCLFGGIDLVNY